MQIKIVEKSNNIKGYINKIIPFSAVDGPGNRTAIFLQGCNFNCSYCHNPETIDLCNGCGKCVSVCPQEALSINNDDMVVWNQNICIECDACINRCEINSSPRVKQMTVNDIYKIIDKNSPFLSGITISGGECTLQLDFITAIFRKVKANKPDLTTFIDTNGHVLFKDKFELMKETDKFMIDAKSFDQKEHQKLTGISNQNVLENIKFTASLDKLYEVRTVIVPKALNNKYNVEKISSLLASLDSAVRYKLIKYRPVGVRGEKINSYLPDDDFMNFLKLIAEDNGCKNVVMV